MYQLFRFDPRNADVESCLNVATLNDAPLTETQKNRIRWLLQDPGVIVSETSAFTADTTTEIGPQLRMETGNSTRLVEICGRFGAELSRAEFSDRYRHSDGADRESIIAKHMDPLLQQVYARPLESFVVGERPRPTEFFSLPLGVESLRAVNVKYQFGLSEKLLAFVLELCEGKDPSEAFLALMAASLSEHSRHGTIKSPINIDGVRQPMTIMEMVQEPWKLNPGKTLVAFHDGAGVIEGHLGVPILMPWDPTAPSWIVVKEVNVTYTLTAETHSHPSYVQPNAGAQTGVGGAMRDAFTQGLGAVSLGMICAGYCTGNYHIPGHQIAGERLGGEVQIGYAAALDAVIGMSDGACDNANKTGVPITQGFIDSYDEMVAGVRRAWLKVICYIGVASIGDSAQFQKRAVTKGMLILRVGSAVRRLGVGGATLSSAEGGTSDRKLDFASVQRPDAVEESAVYRGVKTCVQLGPENPIIDMADSGAGGAGNLFFELVGKLGGELNLDNMRSADPTLTSTEKLIAETQESVGIIVAPESLDLVRRIFGREDVLVEVLGHITGNGRFVVRSHEGVVVDVSVEQALTSPPWTPIDWETVSPELPSLVLPEEPNIPMLVKQVFTLPAVGSKRHVIIKGDQCVGGRIRRQQLNGSMGMHVSDVAMLSASFDSHVGVATARGHKGVLGLINPAAQGRMTVASMCTNMVAACITAVHDIKVRANEMAAIKQRGQGAAMYETVKSSMGLLKVLRIAPHGGKDSLSSAATLPSGETVVGPGQLVIYGHAPYDDDRVQQTVDVKGRGLLMYLNTQGEYRLGGSALAQALGQLGNDCPDIEFPKSFESGLNAILDLHRAGLMSAYHDIGRGGLVTTLLEMFMAGNRGGRVHVPDNVPVLNYLFNEEAGHVFEFKAANADRVMEILRTHGLENDAHIVGTTGSKNERYVTICEGRNTLMYERLTTVRVWWEATATAIQYLQMNPECVDQEVARFGDDREIPYDHTFRTPMPAIIGVARPKAAIIRAKGTNGYEEAIAALYRHKFDVQNIPMRDIFDGRVTSLDDFKFLMFPGGFADGDECGSAKGWASSILFNDRIFEIFNRFYERNDTASFGPCNGAQLMTLLGWAPDVNIEHSRRPRLVKNHSGRFECRWVVVKMLDCNCPLYEGMEGMKIGVWTAHAEGQFEFPDPAVEEMVWREKLVPAVYIDLDGNPTEVYPFNPNRSRGGMAGLVSRNRRHSLLMPHPERCFLEEQMPYVPERYVGTGSPWDRMFRNARVLCDSL